MLDWQTFYNQHKHLPINEIVAKFYKLQALIEENINHQITLSQTTTTAGSAGGVDEGPSVPLGFYEDFSDQPIYTIDAQGLGVTTFIDLDPTYTTVAPSGVRTISLANPVTPPSQASLDFYGYDRRRIMFAYNQGSLMTEPDPNLLVSGTMFFSGHVDSVIYDLLKIKWGNESYPLGSIVSFNQNSIRIFFRYRETKTHTYTLTAIDSIGNISSVTSISDTFPEGAVSSFENYYFDISYDNFIGNADLTNLISLELKIRTALWDDFNIKAIGTNIHSIDGYISL